MKTVKHAMLIASVALGFIVAGQSASATPVIDTTSSDGSVVGTFGEGATQVYGQTFLVTGPETILNDFSMQLDEFDTPINFGAYIAAWDGTKVVGPVLYSSGQQTTTNNGGADGFETFTFNTGGLTLSAGTQYVAYLSVLGFTDGQPDFGITPLFYPGTYDDGQFVFLNTSDPSDLSTTDWSVYIEGADIAFVAHFSAPDTSVPAPAALGLFGIGLIGLAGLRRKAKATV